MSFLKKIFGKSDPSAATPVVRTPSVHLAVFGKHPGWDDHIDDIGVTTDRLVAIKRQLYLQGVGKNIDAGTWEKLPASKRLSEFNHLLLWRYPGIRVVGRLQASLDGKGRGRFPIVICAECIAASRRFANDFATVVVDETLRQCTQTSSAAEVRQIVAAAQQELSRQLHLDPAPAGTGSTPLAELLHSPELGDNAVNLRAVLYRIHTEMRDFLPDAHRTDRATVHASPQMRVPMILPDPHRALRAWVELLHRLLDRSVTVVGLASLEQPWIDLMIDSPGSIDFFCLLASRETIPLTTDIPYKLSPEFMTFADRTIESLRSSVASP